MRLKEQQLWDTMRRNAGAGWYLQRIENVVAEGMPDVLVWSPGGRQTWVELKAPRRPKRSTTRLMGTEGLRIAQVNWHLKAASMGIESYILIRDDSKHLYLLDGSHADKVNHWTAEELDDLSLDDSWEGIFEVLV